MGEGSDVVGETGWAMAVAVMMGVFVRDLGCVFVGRGDGSCLEFEWIIWERRWKIAIVEAAEAGDTVFL